MASEEQVVLAPSPIPMDAVMGGQSHYRLTGRRRIFIKKTDVTRDNLPELLDEVFQIHRLDEGETDYLFRYYRGDQPVLRREKEVRPEICNKVVRNGAFEIVAFKDGYEMGEPVQYVQKGKPGTDGGYVEDGAIAALNEMMDVEGKDSKDQVLWHNAHICGRGYRMVLPSKEGDPVPFRTDIPYPGHTFVVYDSGFGKMPWLCGHYVYEQDGSASLGVYTHTQYFLCKGSVTHGNWMVDTVKAHTMGELPIIEYPYTEERLGAFEPVITELDAMNTVMSNRLDGIEQFIQSLLWLNNCDIDSEQFDQLMARGGIKTRDSSSGPAKVTYLVQQLDQTQTQALVDDLYESILTKAGVPDRNASAGGNTGQALFIGQGWANAETRAKAAELLFKQSERQFLGLLFSIFKKSQVEAVLKSLDLFKVDVKPNRARTDNLLVRTQGLQNLLEAGVHPRIALATCGAFTDPEQVWNDSREYMDKWLAGAGKQDGQQAELAINGTKLLANNKPDPVETGVTKEQTG